LDGGSGTVSLLWSIDRRGISYKYHTFLAFEVTRGDDVVAGHGRVNNLFRYLCLTGAKQKTKPAGYETQAGVGDL
jgi:hypothetical protein